MSKLLNASLKKLDDWLISANYSAYDPFDGLNAWIRPLAVGKLGRQLLQQGVRRFPCNLRTPLGINPERSSKGMGYIARGLLKIFEYTQDQLYLKRATNCLEWLIEHSNRGYLGYSWGNHFDYQSRGFYLPKGEPTVVWTALISHAFLDAWEIIGNNRYLEVAKKNCEFILGELEQRSFKNGICISYIPKSFHAVHNANMHAAAVLSRTYKHTGNEQFRNLAQRAVSYTVGAQRDDGSWWYGEKDNLHWIDNFHTAYVLDALYWYMISTQDMNYWSNFELGLKYYVNKFFLNDGTPKYYSNKVYPFDIQCASQSIETLTLLAETVDPGLIKLAEKVAYWTIDKMQDESGYFYFRRGRHWVNKTAMLHWGQATMLYALAKLILLMEEHQNEN